MAQSIDGEMRGLQRAAQRLEVASKEWEQAYRLYSEALDQLSQKAIPKKHR